ncbi:hypothetical protein [Thermoleptolyngbya sp.]
MRIVLRRRSPTASPLAFVLLLACQGLPVKLAWLCLSDRSALILNALVWLAGRSPLLAHGLSAFLT